MQLTIEQKRIIFLAKLHEGLATVVFTKVDGTVRTMQCTLKEDLLPAKIEPVTAQVPHFTNTDNPIDFPKVKKEKKKNTDVICAYAVDKQAWRSFRVDSVISIS